MVRLVFRPYTQIWRSICTSESLRRSICTSESLRASTRVSSGFTLFRHSSPSFGSQQMRSYSNLPENRIGRSMMHVFTLSPLAPKCDSLSLRRRVSFARRLAHMLDSLVRVSRRVERGHFDANVLGTWYAIAAPATGSGRGALHAVHRIRLPTGETRP